MCLRQQFWTEINDIYLIDISLSDRVQLHSSSTRRKSPLLKDGLTLVYAGCWRTRKSKQCGVMLFGCHLIQPWSSTQASIAVSSGEAEFYALVKRSLVAFGIRNRLHDSGIKAKLRISTEAAAAQGVTARGRKETAHWGESIMDPRQSHIGWHYNEKCWHYRELGRRVH